MVQVDVIGNLMHRVIHEDASHGPIERIVFAGTVRVENPHADGLGAEPHRGVANLELVCPLRYGVVVELLHWNAIWD